MKQIDENNVKISDFFFYF